jgi:hypothetical protein
MSPELEKLRQTIEGLSKERENLLFALRKKEREVKYATIVPLF